VFNSKSSTLTNWTIMDNVSSDTIPTITIGPGGYVIVHTGSSLLNQLTRLVLRSCDSPSHLAPATSTERI